MSAVTQRTMAAVGVLAGDPKDERLTNLLALSRVPAVATGRDFNVTVLAHLEALSLALEVLAESRPKRARRGS